MDGFVLKPTQGLDTAGHTAVTASMVNPQAIAVLGCSPAHPANPVWKGLVCLISIHLVTSCCCLQEVVICIMDTTAAAAQQDNDHD